MTGNKNLFTFALGVTSAANHPWQLHRQIFFTECILTGGSAPCRLPGVLQTGGQPPQGARQLFLTNRTLTGSPASVLRRAIGYRPQSEPDQRTDNQLSRIHRKPTIIWCDVRLATPHQVFLTDHTLTGRTILHLFSGAIVGLMSNTIIVFAAGFDTKEV